MPEQNMQAQKPVWPARLWIWTLMSVFLALGAIAGFCWLNITFARTLQRFYVGPYVKASITKGAEDLFGKVKPREFPVVYLDGRRATDDLIDSSESRLQPAEPKMYTADEYIGWLDRHVYEGQTLFYWLRTGVYEGAALGLLLLCGGMFLDVRQGRIAREGRVIRGPNFATRAQWNMRNRRGGIRILVDNPPSFTERAFTGERCIRISPKKVSQHHIIMGTSGSGKTTLIREYAYNFEIQGVKCVVADPENELTGEFFDANRGDYKLDPTDARCPYWDLGAECRDEAEAMAIAKGFLPNRADRQSEWFDRHARAILAYLLSRYHPNCAQLAKWLANPKRIDELVAGTEHAGTIAENAPGQRQAILGTLNEIGRALRMMPESKEGRQVWTATEYARDMESKAWIFISSTPETEEAVRPLQSLWIDLLILKMQTQRPKGAPPTAMIIDEVASFQQIPQLKNALTRNRKRQMPIVLGFHGVAQFEEIYGEKSAETMLGMPYTSWFLRTTEDGAAERVSRLIGSSEFLELNESQGGNSGGGMNYGSSTHRVVRPLMLPGEIYKMEDLTGVVKQLGMVVRIKFTPRILREQAPARIERRIPVFIPSLFPEIVLPPKRDKPKSEAGTTEPVNEVAEAMSKTGGGMQMTLEGFGRAVAP